MSIEVANLCIPVNNQEPGVLEDIIFLDNTDTTGQDAIGGEDDLSSHGKTLVRVYPNSIASQTFTSNASETAELQSDPFETEVQKHAEIRIEKLIENNETMEEAKLAVKRLFAEAVFRRLHIVDRDSAKTRAWHSLQCITYVGCKSHEY